MVEFLWVWNSNNSTKDEIDHWQLKKKILTFHQVAGENVKVMEIASQEELDSLSKTLAISGWEIDQKAHTRYPEKIKCWRKSE